MRAPTLSLKGRALRLLAQREHSRYELEQKLKPHEMQEGELKKALDTLEEKIFISELRVMESVVYQKGVKLGALRIKQELQNKKIAQPFIAQAMAELKETELSRAQKVWQQKYGEPAKDNKGKAKQIRFLLSRGFDAQVIRKIIPDVDRYDGDFSATYD
ncbi:MAG: recombination regulator RecX [Limnohabitans sp.]|nr:recombination regulator RecX [Limnohabitans sp.]